MNVFAKVVYLLVGLFISVIIASLAGEGFERWVTLGAMAFMVAALGVVVFRGINRHWPEQ